MKRSLFFFIFLLVAVQAQASILDDLYGTYQGQYGNEACTVVVARTGLIDRSIAIQGASPSSTPFVEDGDYREYRVSKHHKKTEIRVSNWQTLGPIKATASAKLELDANGDLISAELGYNNSFLGLGRTARSHCQDLRLMNR
jgi:hypothetical protein